MAAVNYVTRTHQCR